MKKVGEKGMGKLLWVEWKGLRGNRAFWLLVGSLVGFRWCMWRCS